MKKALRLISFLWLAAMMVAVPASLFAQNDINLQDGTLGWHFNGNGSRQVTMLIPSQDCNGGVCYMANGHATGTGVFQGSGTYTITTPSQSPLTLTVNADGSSTVTQNAPITFSYNSTSGTLTGLLQFTTISATNSHLQSTAPASLTVTGGTFGQYFPAGGMANFTIGLTFPIQQLWRVHGFATAEVVNGTISPNAACSQQSSNSSNFNGNSIAAGDYIWFNANFAVQGSVTDGTTLTLTNATISFSANGNNYVLPAPNAMVNFSASASCISTMFDSLTNTWITTVPLSSSDEVFLDGLEYQVPAPGLPGGINPIVWEGEFSSNVSGLQIQWKWGAAVYTQFSTDYSAVGVKPSHTNSCAYNNSDHAGTPENFKNYVIGGARGGGGSNWTGSWSGTVNVSLVCQ